MNIGVCTIPENVKEIPPALEFVEVTVVGFLIPDKDESEFVPHASAASKCPLPVVAANSMLPGWLKSVGPDVDKESLDRYVDVMLQRSGRTGIDTVVFGSWESRMVPDGFDRSRARQQLTEHLRRWGDMAERAGVTIVIESLNDTECNIVNTLDEGAELCRAVNHPSVKVHADLYHMARMNESPDAVTSAGDLIHHVHVADAPGRTAPTAGNDALEGYFRALGETGYDGRVSIECNWDDFDTQLPKAVRVVNDYLKLC